MPPPPKFAKLSKILWKSGKFWKTISVDQIHSGGEGNELEKEKEKEIKEEKRKNQK